MVIFMFDFLANPTKNSWDENVFMLTKSGVIVIVVLIVILIGIALFFAPKEHKSSKAATKQLVFSAIAMALGMVSSMFKFFSLPMGGSITLFSMLFITLIGYWYGARAGIMTAVAYGLLQFVVEPVFYSIPQMIVDYPLAFGALGLSGFFSRKKHGLIIGYLVGVLGRFAFAFLSGLIFFASYAEGSGMSAPIYSLCYNAMYLLPEAILTCLVLIIPVVTNAFSRVKKTAVE